MKFFSKLHIMKAKGIMGKLPSVTVKLGGEWERGVLCPIVRIGTHFFSAEEVLFEFKGVTRGDWWPECGPHVHVPSVAPVMAP